MTREYMLDDEGRRLFFMLVWVSKIYSVKDFFTHTHTHNTTHTHSNDGVHTQQNTHTHTFTHRVACDFYRAAFGVNSAKAGKPK